MKISLKKVQKLRKFKMEDNINETKKKILKSLKGQQEIVINKCWGGFGLSIKEVRRYAELSGFKIYVYKREQPFFSSNNEKYERIDDEDEEKDNTIKLLY